MNPKQMGALVIDALEDIKAKNIVMINVTKLTSLFDYIVIASGDSNRQTKALASNVRDKLKEAGAQVYGSEGEETGEWVLVDLGDVVVHVMQPTTREYYRLEELWRDGKIEFPKPVKAAADLPATVKVKPRVAAKAKAATEKDAKKPATRKPAAKRPETRKPAGTGKVGAKSSAKADGKTTARATTTAELPPKVTSKVAAKARTSSKATAKSAATSTATVARRRTTKAK